MPFVHRSRRRPGRHAAGSAAFPGAGRLLLALALTCALAACTGSSSPAPPTSVPSEGAPTAVAPTPGASAVAPSPSPAAASPSLPTQTDTAWGRIWDALPPSFPVYPGSQSSPPMSGPASGLLTTPASADTVASWTVSALRQAGFHATASSPAEDGSRTIDATAAGGCKVQVTVKPQGTVTMMTVLYGASCPYR